MSVPSIATLRTEAADIIAICSRGQMEAIETGAMAAAVSGGPLSATSTAQALITACQPLIDQADSDCRAIHLRYLLKFLAGQGASAISVGVAGDGWVFKNGFAWLLFDDGLYRKNIGVMVEGQPQSGYENAGYAYNSIP